MANFRKVRNPCPFCGSLKIESKGAYDFNSEKAGYKVLCGHCGASTKLYANHRAAVKAWDRRPGDVNWEERTIKEAKDETK